MLSPRAGWLLLALWILAGSLHAANPDRYALLVAIDQYPFLGKVAVDAHAEADAKALAEVFRKMDYEVDLLLGEQATKSSIHEKLRNKDSFSGPKDVFVLGLFVMQLNSSTQHFFLRGGARQMDSVSFQQDLLPSIERLPAAYRMILLDTRQMDATPPEWAGGRTDAADHGGTMSKNLAMLIGSSKNMAFQKHPEWPGQGAFATALMDGLGQGKTDIYSLSEHVLTYMEALAKKHPDFKQKPVPVVSGYVDLLPPAGIRAARAPSIPVESSIGGRRGPKREVEPPSTSLEAPPSLVAPFSSEEIRAFRKAWARFLKSPETWSNSKVGMTFVLIPPGEFLMGSGSEEKGRQSREQPQRLVRITRPFYMGVHEVTVSQFNRFVSETGYIPYTEQPGKGGSGYNKSSQIIEFGKQYSWRNPGFGQQNTHPVVNVSWEDAEAYVRWVESRELDKYSLPTEAQWEYACRAGTTGRFHTGDDLEVLRGEANVADLSLKRVAKISLLKTNVADGVPFTAPVGRFPANPFGLHDMHGNAAEWCQDWYHERYYANSPPTDDPPGAASGTLRSVRGGSWLEPPTYSAARSGVVPGKAFCFLGFRVVREIELPDSPTLPEYE